MCRRTTLILTLGTLAIASAGCQSSGVAQRRAQRIEVYQSFDAATRRLVDKGGIQNGMDTNAVFIAWGQPTDAFTIGLPGGGQRLIWNYEEKWAYEFKRRTRAAPSPVYTMAPYGYTPQPTYQRGETERWRIPITYVSKSVTFSEGKVMEWKKLKPPAYSQPTDVSPETGRRY